MKPSVSVGCKYFWASGERQAAAAVAKTANQTKPKPSKTKSKPNQIEAGRTACSAASLKTPNRYANSATTNEAYTQIAKRAELSWVATPPLAGRGASGVVLTKFVAGSSLLLLQLPVREKTAETCVAITAPCHGRSPQRGKWIDSEIDTRPTYAYPPIAIRPCAGSTACAEHLLWWSTPGHGFFATIAINCAWNLFLKK